MLDGNLVSLKTTSNTRLLDLIRKDAGNTSVREGCGEGECGACSILLDGKLVNACSTAAISAHGKNVITSYGFSETEEYKIISDAFAEAGAVQCGFCTPGFIMATAALLMRNADPSTSEIKTALSGNLCRCTGYTMIIDAVKIASKNLKNCEKTFFSKILNSSEFIFDKTDANVLLPETIEQALTLVKEGFIPVAGGTDLIVRNHATRKESFDDHLIPPQVFSTSKIKNLNNIKTKNGCIEIGAGAKISEIIDFDKTPQILRESLKSIASPGIRNAATLAGNICNASPAGDSLPALYILDANINYFEMKNNEVLKKTIPIKDFITAPGKTILNNNEKSISIVSSISIKLLEGYDFIYKKLGTRAANALSKLNISVIYKKKNNNFIDFKLAIGACAPTIIRNITAEQLLIKHGQEKLDKILSLYSECLTPIDDQRSTATYRKNTALKIIEDIILNTETYSC